MFLLLFSPFLLGAVSLKFLDLREGDECRPLGGGPGICRALKECKTAGDITRTQSNICTFKNREPVICCPNALASKKKVGHRAEQLCKVLEMKCRNDPMSQPPLIVGKGGVEAAPRSQPFMALIGYGDQNDISWGCGGSLITARHVLSAAHCVNPSPSMGVARWARLGELDLSSTTEDAKPIDMRIIERIPYPDYIGTQSYHDIAIFKLESDVVFNAWISPICLHTKREIESRMSTMIGWGRTDFDEGTSDKLLDVHMEVYNATECNRLMFSSSSTKAHRGYLSDLMFCAGAPDGSKDACPGDSGGPLVTRKKGYCIKPQIGVTSYGNFCGLPNSPGVYTRVSNYIGWIEDVVGDEMIV